LSDRRTKGNSVAMQQGVLMIGLLLLSGCNAGQGVRGSTLYQRIARRGHLDSTPRAVPGKMAAAGGEEIAAECEHESYANASKGLIVGETGLHEDVFALRDRESFAANAYRMDEALRLEDLLREQANAVGHSAEQADCMVKFADHLQTLTDALIQADRLHQELDVSAFNNSKKQAEEQLERRQREIEQPATPDPR
jgi:hypothetical protein